jgi:hypothetical protein
MLQRYIRDYLQNADIVHLAKLRQKIRDEGSVSLQSVTDIAKLVYNAECNIQYEKARKMDTRISFIPFEQIEDYKYIVIAKQIRQEFE